MLENEGCLKTSAYSIYVQYAARVARVGYKLKCRLWEFTCLSISCICDNQFLLKSPAAPCTNSGEVYASCASKCRQTCNDPLPNCFSLCEPGCMCPAGQVLDPATASCMNKEECAFFELNGEKHSNGSSVQLSDVKELNDSLIFKTDFTDCCREQKRGECYRPDGKLVPLKRSGARIYRNHGEQLLRLNHRQRGAPPPEGLYCCEVPISVSETKRVCVNILV